MSTVAIVVITLAMIACIVWGLLYFLASSMKD